MKTIDSTTGFPPDLFEATRWSVVVAAADSGQGSDCQLALSELCQTYWFPVYAYLRRKGYGKPQAEDLAQGFFARLLEKKSYTAADPDRAPSAQSLRDQRPLGVTGPRLQLNS